MRRFKFVSPNASATFESCRMRFISLSVRYITQLDFLELALTTDTKLPVENTFMQHATEMKLLYFTFILDVRNCS